MNKYILINKKAVKCNNPSTWAKELEIANRQVAYKEINGIAISTVFLGLDHSWNGPPPLLFETLVFGGALDGEMFRYETWEEAEKGHAIMVKRVKKKIKEEGKND